MNKSEKEELGRVERLVRVIKKNSTENDNMRNMTTPNKVQSLVKKFEVDFDQKTVSRPRIRLQSSSQSAGFEEKILDMEKRGGNPQKRIASNVILKSDQEKLKNKGKSFAKKGGKLNLTSDIRNYLTRGGTKKVEAGEANLPHKKGQENCFVQKQVQKGLAGKESVDRRSQGTPH